MAMELFVLFHLPIHSITNYFVFNVYFVLVTVLGTEKAERLFHLEVTRRIWTNKHEYMFLPEAGTGAQDESRGHQPSSLVGVGWAEVSPQTVCRPCQLPLPRPHLHCLRSFGNQRCLSWSITVLGPGEQPNEEAEDDGAGKFILLCSSYKTFHRNPDF